MEGIKRAFEEGYPLDPWEIETTAVRIMREVYGVVVKEGMGWK